MNTNVLVARRKAELTQEELADKVGIGRGDVSRIESQGWTPTLDIQEKIVKVLNANGQSVTRDDLFGQMADVAS